MHESALGAAGVGEVPDASVALGLASALGLGLGRVPVNFAVQTQERVDAVVRADLG